MKRSLPAAAILLFLLPTLASADGEPGDGGSDKKSDDALQKRINAAIERGADWLITQQNRDGSFELKGKQAPGAFPSAQFHYGETALATLTLAHCGCTTKRTEMRKALGYLKKHWQSIIKGDPFQNHSTYAMAITVMLLHKLFAQPVADDERGERYAKSRKKNPCRYPSWAHKVIKTILDWIVKNRAKEGVFRYPGGLPEQPGGMAGPGGGAPAGMQSLDGPEDMSCTQYALLALWMGSRCGYDIDPKVLEHIGQRLLAWQAPRGPPVERQPDPDLERNTKYAPFKHGRKGRDQARGFGYLPGHPASGSMTSAGLSSLVIVKAMLLERGKLSGEMRRELDKGIWDAIAWHTAFYSLARNPRGNAMWHYYYLYGLERAFVIAGKQYIGKHDWYREGAEFLLRAQNKSGQWNPKSTGGGGFVRPGGGGGGMQPAGGAMPHSSSLHDTCFALLFLKRAALKPRMPLLRGPAVTEGGESEDGKPGK